MLGYRSAEFVAFVGLPFLHSHVHHALDIPGAFKFLAIMLSPLNYFGSVHRVPEKPGKEFVPATGVVHVDVPDKTFLLALNALYRKHYILPGDVGGAAAPWRCAG